MNEYAKEGHRFLNSIGSFFRKFEKILGKDIYSIMRDGESLQDYNMPNPSELLAGMSAMIAPGDYILPLTMHSRRSFDGYLNIGNVEGHITDSILRVIVSEMGAWQLTQLLVMSMHVMPLYWHANYMKWTPVFCSNDLQKLRKSRRQFSSIVGQKYDFLPATLPADSIVMPIEEGRSYRVSFYIWSDFGGYAKVTSTVKFPQNTIFALVKDVEVFTETEEIIPYRVSVIL